MFNKLKIFLINVLLFIIAIILLMLFSGVGLLTSFIKISFYKASTNYFKDCAIVIDILGNVLCQHLFNLTLIKRDSKNKFGKRKETISSVLGKNILTSEIVLHKIYYLIKIKYFRFLKIKMSWYSDLTFLGNVLSNILDFFDKNHCVKSVDNNV